MRRPPGPRLHALLRDSDSPYLPGPRWPAERVPAYLDEQKGRHFDPRCVDALPAEINQAAGF